MAMDTMIVEETPTTIQSSEDQVVAEQPEVPVFVEVVEVEEEPVKLPGSEMIVEEDDTMEVEEENEQEAHDMQPKETDWANDKDHSKFITYIKSKLLNIPKHSGKTIPGCERALSYLKETQNELTKAMRTDLSGVLDDAEIDSIYSDIEDKIELLEKHLTKLRSNTSKKIFASPKVNLIVDGQCDNCKTQTPTWHDVENDRVVCLNCNAEVGSNGIEKVASTPQLNVVVTAFERAVVSTLINGSVSGGKNIVELFETMDKQYKFTDREKLAIRQLIADYGFGMVLDRAKINKTDGVDNGELARNYNA